MHSSCYYFSFHVVYFSPVQLHSVWVQSPSVCVCVCFDVRRCWMFERNDFTAVTHPRQSRGFQKHVHTSIHRKTRAYIRAACRHTVVPAVCLFESYFMPIFSIFNLDHFLGITRESRGFPLCGKASKKALKRFWNPPLQLESITSPMLPSSAVERGIWSDVGCVVWKPAAWISHCNTRKIASSQWSVILLRSVLLI